MDCFALLDDCHATAANPTSRLYTGLVREHRCHDPRELEQVWAAADRDVRAGGHAVVLADYEWGARLIGAGHENLTPEHGGTLRFLIFEHLERLSAEGVERWLRAQDEDAAEPQPAGVLNLHPSVDRAAFLEAIGRIHDYIREGETYQVNYTYRLDFQAFGTPVSLYRRLRARQPVDFGAFIALPGEEGHVLSLSPELFLSHRQGTLYARPMKGTAPRAGVVEGDSEIARMLSQDTKNRAENLMIVDLLRNDLGRIARTGSVKVPKLFAVEPYHTVFQMTSTIEAEVPARTGFAELLRALFPCGSITGAPKHRTMQIIAELETTPRGLYTGAIGWIDAPGPRQADAAFGDFCLSVAIRTLTLGTPRGSLRPGRMGVGAGIIIDSQAHEEFEECALKARFLTGLDPGFTLFETMYAERTGIRHLARHLARLGNSAAALGFAFPGEAVERALAEQLCALDDDAMRLRLALHHDGRFDIVVAPLEAPPAGPVDLLLDEAPVDGADPLLRHKTTRRARFDAALATAKARGAFDVLFANADGRLTEGARSNLFLYLDGAWLTPPAAAGLLPGVMRSVLLAEWGAREAELTVADLERAERIVVCNALRGPLEARLVGTL
jgi:para-aminobenzoate synthetase/4-amino-4-deoxychorismate lyase